jgi:hypothetical protein
LGYIMVALILLGVVTAGLSRLQDEQAGAEWVDRAQATLRENLQVIRSQVMLCAASNSTDAAGLVASMPVSEDDENGDLLPEVVCPGFGESTRLFDGSNTVFAPEPPRGFDPWRYVNDLQVSGNIFAYTSTSDPNGVAAANRLSKSVPADQLVVGTAAGTTTITYYLRVPPSGGGGG